MEVYMPWIAAALSLAAVALHFIAPKTKNTIDDMAAQVVDRALEMMPRAK